MQGRARNLASRVCALEDPGEKIRTLYRLTLGRHPHPHELDLALRFLSERRSQLGREPWEEYAQLTALPALALLDVVHH